MSKTFLPSVPNTLVCQLRDYLSSVPSGDASMIATFDRNEFDLALRDARIANVPYCCATDYDGDTEISIIVFWGEDFRRNTRLGFILGDDPEPRANFGTES